MVAFVDNFWWAIKANDSYKQIMLNIKQNLCCNLDYDPVKLNMP